MSCDMRPFLIPGTFFHHIVIVIANGYCSILNLDSIRNPEAHTPAPALLCALPSRLSKCLSINGQTSENMNSNAMLVMNTSAPICMYVACTLRKK